MSEKSPLRQAQEKFVAAVAVRSTGEESSFLLDALGRTLYQPVVAPHDMPPYPRAIVEGFLVNAKDTEGATEQSPKLFNIVGRVAPGDATCPKIGSGEAVEVATGSLVSNDPVAIVRAWEAERVDANRIAVKRVFPPRFFIEEQGCDLSAHVEVLPAGIELGPWELGLAAGLGVEEVSVARRPTVALFSCGAEVIAFNEPLGPGLIRDSNSIMLSAAITRAGAIPRFAGIMPDDFETFRGALAKALKENDMVVISGGTAVGGRDFVSDLIRDVGELLVDGVPMKSGRPLIMGAAAGTPIVGVAGHPPEALRGFRLFGQAAIDRMLGRERAVPEDSV